MIRLIDKLGMDKVMIKECTAHALMKFAGEICDGFEISEVLGEFFTPCNENYTKKGSKHYSKLNSYLMSVIKNEGIHFYNGCLGGTSECDSKEEFNYIMLDRYKAVAVLSATNGTVITVTKYPEYGHYKAHDIKRELSRGRLSEEEEDKRDRKLRVLSLGVVWIKSAKAKNELRRGKYKV